MGKKFRNLGFTLVEMIVAFAVLGVATLGIGGFFVTSARSSAGTSSQSQVQNEAQLAMNQMERLIIDTGLGLNYNVITAEGDHFVLTDAGFDSALVESKLLYIFNVDPEDASNIQLILLKWDKDQNIYYKEINLDEAGYGASNVEDLNVEAIGEWELLAEGVDSFSAILDGERKKVSLSANFVRSDDNYQASAVITVRNDIVVNELSLEKLFDRIDVVVKTRITGVKIAVSPKITASGSSAMLKSEILGKGDPEKNMDLAWQWLVATDSGMNNLIYDSINSGDWAASIADGNLSLDISKLGEEFNGVVYIQAIVTAKEKENPENVTVVKSGVAELKIIDQMSISFSKDGVDYSNSLGTDASAVEAYELETEETLQLYANIEGKALESSEKAVIWSIAEGATAEASVSSDGLLTVDRQSKPGTFVVRATLKANQSVWVEYPFEVVSEYVTDAALVVTPAKEVLLRGEEVAHTVKLGKQDVLAEDCDWTVTVKNVSANQVVTGSPVTVGSAGVVSVLDNLAYEYDYKVTVTAALKKDATIKGSAELSIPKVTFKVETPRNYIVPGGVIEGVKCTVTGLKDYMVNWTMAKSNASDYFFTAYGNSHITGYETGNHLANVVLGSDDTTIEYIFVKASLEGSKNFTDMVKIETPTMAIQGAASVVRGGSAAYKVAIAGMDSPTGVIWRIKNQPDGVEIGAADGVLKVRPDFNWSMKDYDTTVTVQAEWNGMKREFVVTIPKTKFVLNPTSVSVDTDNLFIDQDTKYFDLEIENLVGTYGVQLVDGAGNLIPSKEATIETLKPDILNGYKEYKLTVKKAVQAEMFYVQVFLNNYPTACTVAEVSVEQQFSLSGSNVNRGGTTEIKAYRNNNILVPSADVTWTVTNVNDANKKYVSINDGVLAVAPEFAWGVSNASITVQAEWKGHTKSIKINVNNAAFTLEPNDVTIVAGGQRTFTLSVSNIETIDGNAYKLKLVDASNNDVNSNIARGTQHGNTIDVTANVDSLAGTYYVLAYAEGYPEITTRIPFNIVQSISVEAFSINRGGAKPLVARKSDNTVISSGVNWSVVNNPDAERITIADGKLYIAHDYNWSNKSSSSSFVVQASWQGGTATQTVVINPAAFEITPNGVVIEAGTSANFGYNSENIDTINRIEWSLEGSDSHVIVKDNGNGTATVTADNVASSATIKLIGRINGISNAFASVDVTIKPTLVISSADNVNRGGSIKLALTDKAGSQSISGVDWSIVGDSTGLSINGDTLKVAPNYAWDSKGSNKAITIRATYQGVSVEKQIIVNSAKFELNPASSTTLTAGGSQTFVLNYENIEGISVDKISFGLNDAASTAATITKNGTSGTVKIASNVIDGTFGVQANAVVDGVTLSTVAKVTLKPMTITVGYSSLQKYYKPFLGSYRWVDTDEVDRYNDMKIVLTSNRSPVTWSYSGTSSTTWNSAGNNTYKFKVNSALVWENTFTITGTYTGIDVQGKTKSTTGSFSLDVSTI